MNITETLFLNIVSRMENGFGELKAEVKASRDASDQGRKDLHKRMDRFEDHTKAELKELRTDMRRIQSTPTSPSSTGLFKTIEITFKVLGVVYTQWPKIVWALTMLAAAWGIKNPAFLKVFAQAAP